MGDSEANLLPVLEGEEKLIAAAQQIVKALQNKKDLTHDARKILADLGSQLMSSITKVEDDKLCSTEDTTEKSKSKLDELEEQLNILQNKVMSWEEVNHESVIWDCGQEYVIDYLRSVDEARKLTEQLESTLEVDKDSKEEELLCRAQEVVRIAMNWLEEEFRHLLVQNKQPFEPEHMSFRSNEDDEGSIASFGDDSVEDVVQRDSMSRRSEEYVVELVHPDVIPDLRCIANLMFNSNYSSECSQAFVNVRKDALDDFLFILEVDKLSIDDVVKMEWNSLNSKIRRWIRCMKIFVRVYLVSEKWLSDQIFGELEHSVSSICFVESSKGSILHLLKFAESVAVGPHQPEKLIRILDMYEVLSDLIPDIDVMFSDDHAGLCVRTECQDILRSLAGCARTTFLEFENAIASSVSEKPFRGGGIHHLTRYVMNYMKTLTDYSKILNELLKGDEEDSSEDHMTQDREEEEEEEDNSNRSSCYISPLAQYFRSFTSILECNLDDKSKLYKDESLGHLFLMNNIHYMAEKVKNSHDLRTILGDDWIRKHNWRFQQHAMNYERATWSSILSLLRDEGLHNPGSNSISKTLLKERLQCFYVAFDEVYKSQTGWSIQDSQLRDDLRISTSLKVIQAYRTFVGRHSNHISDKHIKYSADDMENFLMDLFEGSPRSLHASSHRGK
ncbi:exocyst complex component EXO70E2-like [Solanum dulcamara]|uniref:exocyst complex component EXO70E2-like n=1 Tax=Solanum dulcamara TaxID=45834 RepID=UPI002485C9B6|nr:exocyst complex component EXO70E2-like [Solanum dulcamara]